MSGPLEGLRVLDFTINLPGPFATLILADLGADVLRVTSGTRLDLSQALTPILPDTSNSAAYAYLTRGKRSMTLNFKHPASSEVVHRLLSRYDILIEQTRPGMMKKFGFDYKSLKETYPRLIYCSITGYGQTGPFAHRAGHDINYIALSGLMSYSGRRKEGPTLSGMQIADVASGSNNAIIAVLAAVVSRASSGKGQYIDISLTDGVTSYNALVGAAFLVDGKDPSREEFLLNGGSLYDFYKTSDEKYISVGCLEPHFFQRFCEVIGRKDLISAGIQPKNSDEVKSEVQEVIGTKTRDEWTEVFSQEDACVEPVLSLSEALFSEHAAQRELVVEVRGPGKQMIKQLANPIKFSETKQTYQSVGVTEGTHTEEVMRELGYIDKEITNFEKKGLFD